MKGKVSSKDIAVAGLSAALSLVFAACSVFVDVLTLTFAVCSAAALMLPLTRGRYVAGLLGYVGASCVLMLLASPVLSLPYIVVFGGYTLFTCIAEDKGWQKLPVWIIKVVWINAALALFYFGTKTLVVNFEKLGFELKYGYLAVLATAIGLIYDVALLYVYKCVKAWSAKYLHTVSKDQDD